MKTYPGQTYLEDEDKVVCQICFRAFDMINWTHLNSHNISFEEYRSSFPDVPIMNNSQILQRASRENYDNSEYYKGKTEVRDCPYCNEQKTFYITTAKSFTRCVDCRNNNVPLNEEYFEIFGESIEKTRQRMLNGQSVEMMSKIQNPSKPQVELFEIIKQVFPNAELNYPLKEVNRCLDVAIPDIKLNIEYDEPYWHDKEKDNFRDELLQSLGWNIIRYERFIPTRTEFINDIKEKIGDVYVEAYYN